MPRWFLYLLLLTCARVVALNKEKVKPQKVKPQKGKMQRVKPQTLSRGWGDNITWAQTYEEALSKMIESQKPLMVIHHQEDCPHSQALKKVFAVSKSIQKMAKEDFIMLNLVHETIDKNLAPDGNYVPRILFVDPSMTVRTDIIGRYSNHLYTYEPKDLVLLASNMRKAKALLHTEL
ncbi:anterior gradient 1 [Myripristis murdjan]|uniref:anterior gradient 1 n=1 Tax=Myripristis murdjan TaxID=586833 RepID=UPI0011763D54|nr:anterior gradient protein 2 homolog [Myripristis murdjan]